MSEDLEGAAQEVDEVHEVAAGPTVRLGHAPFVVGQLDELVDLLVELGVDLALGRVPGVLETTDMSRNFGPGESKGHRLKVNTTETRHGGFLTLKVERP